MKRSILLFVILSVTLVLNSGAQAQFPDVTIQDIQTVDPDSLAIGIDDSPFVGDTVTTRGIVVFPPGLSSSVPQGAAVVYIVDPAGGGEYSGMNVLTQANEGNLLGGFQLGDSIRVTGLIEEFEGSGDVPGSLTQLRPIQTPDLLGFVAPPEPVEIDPAEFAGTTLDTVELAMVEKWESVLVKITNTSVVNDEFDDFSSWIVEDANQNQTIVSALSDSLRTINDVRGTGNVDPSAAFVVPPVGTSIEEITGIVDVRFDISLNPRFPSLDIQLGAGVPPALSNHNRNPVGPTSAEDVDVTIEITDEDGTVASASLFYNVDGGNDMEVSMTPTSGDTFAATIPAQANGSLVTYYVRATDDTQTENVAPSGAPDDDRFLYYVRDEGIRISDLQMNPFGESTGYFGLTVTVNGVAVSDSADFGDRFFFQQGSGEYSGITVFTGSGNVTVGRGDSLAVTGRATEFRGLTEIDLDSVEVISTGNLLPDPVDVSTGDVNTDGPLAESFESVLIRVSNVEITNGDLGFGEWLIDDGSGGLRVDDRGQYSFSPTDTASANFTPEGTTIGSLTGLLDFTFGDFKLQPRDDNDFVDVVTDVEDFGPRTPESFTLFQNYPNPFNPETTIQYSLESSQEVQLKIFNVLGQQVRNLHDQRQTAGVHRIVWDGKNDRGVLVPSGVYIYQIKAGDFEESKKMILLK